MLQRLSTQLKLNFELILDLRQGLLRASINASPIIMRIQCHVSNIIDDSRSRIQCHVSNIIDDSRSRIQCNVSNIIDDSR